jgi:hypothetical protein
VNVKNTAQMDTSLIKTVEDVLDVTKLVITVSDLLKTNVTSHVMPLDSLVIIDVTYLVMMSKAFIKDTMLIWKPVCVPHVVENVKNVTVQDVMEIVSLVEKKASSTTVIV